MQSNNFNLPQKSSKLKNYRVIKTIGFGASGTIYQVQKKSNNFKDKKIFILKQIPIKNTGISLEDTVELIKKAQNESSILSNLNYKYIVKYYESFIEDDNLNIIMDYYEKGDLNCLINNLIESKKFLKEEKIWNLFIQMSLGLEYIHQKNIIHRDLKPMNIFLSDNNIIKIGDLGVAKIIKNQTKSNTFLGTPYYMSPELFEGKPYNSKTDVWALGCILYELCSLIKPFNALNQAALGMKIIEGKYIHLNEIKGIPLYCKKFEYFVDKMLEKDCNKRPFMKDIIKDKFFFKKAKELGYENDINYLLNNFRKSLDYNNKNRANSLNLKKRKNIKMKRLNFSAICSNKKSCRKIPKLNSYKISNKKLKSKYQILSSYDNNIIQLKDKSDVGKSSKNTIINSRNRDINNSAKNILTTINNYQKRDEILIPSINLKKFIIKNSLSRKNSAKKLTSKFHQYINLNNKGNSSNIPPYINKSSMNQKTNKNENIQINKEISINNNKNLLKNFINKKCNNLPTKGIKIKGIKIISINKKYSSKDKLFTKNIKTKNDNYIPRKNTTEEIKNNSEKNIKKENEEHVGNKIYFNQENKDKIELSFESKKENEELIMTQSTTYNINKNIEENSEDENSDIEEKVSIFTEKDEIKFEEEKIKKQKEEYIMKYNKYKEEIMKYEKLIDINKLFELYGLISKNKDKIEDITQKIERYLKTNLQNENYKKLKKLFQNFIFYDLNIDNINRFN